MAEPLENLARRLEDDPFFLGCALRLYTTSARLSEQELAERLGCPVQTLVLLRLCRAPKPEGRQFQKDIARIAETYQVHAAVLTDAVRRGQAIWHLRQGTASGAGSLLAARDSDGDVNLEEDR